MAALGSSDRLGWPCGRLTDTRDSAGIQYRSPSRGEVAVHRQGSAKTSPTRQRRVVSPAAMAGVRAR
jgi:hypothetical protein